MQKVDCQFARPPGNSKHQSISDLNREFLYVLLCLPLLDVFLLVVASRNLEPDLFVHLHSLSGFGDW